MKVCILGAGAIGSIIAVRLALAGEEVCVVERGSRLAQIRRDGLRIRWQDGMVYTARVGVFTRLTEVGEQDLVVLAVKAYDLEEAVQHIDGLLSGNTGVMTVQNGIPWWYFQKVGGSFDGAPLVSVDPNGKLSNAISPDRLIGCVTYAAAALQAQGTVQHVEGDRLTVGELDGSMTERMRRISEAFERAGLKSRVISDIRAEIWLKAWGSLSFNPISALTRTTLAEIAQFPPTRQLAATMMVEAQTIAAKLGITFRHTIKERIEGIERVGAHKTSMLQDLEEGRSLETEALVGARRRRHEAKPMCSLGSFSRQIASGNSRRRAFSGR